VSKIDRNIYIQINIHVCIYRCMYYYWHFVKVRLIYSYTCSYLGIIIVFGSYLFIYFDRIVCDLLLLMPFWLVCILHIKHSFLVCVVNEFCVSKHHHHHIHIGGRYKVNLREPYGQMVIEECIFLANYRSGICYCLFYYYWFVFFT
jgi:hypothetical protein